MNRDRKSAISIIIYCAVIGICLLTALYVCAHKAGFHEDEYYTYYSSNRTDGFWVEDGKFMDRQTILNEFSVVPGEGFNFGLVKEVQSWDVHPPVYYFAVHLICSLTAGKFSMWQGLSLNLICFVISLILIMLLVKKLLPGEQFRYVPAAVSLIVGTSAATLTAVVFIRMYMLLTVWFLAITLLHVNYLQREEKSKASFYIELALLTFLGFMTHYYFFIWLFFLAVAVNLYELVTTRKWMGIIKYGVTMVVTFGLSYAFYPAWPAQMFRGQRGAQATGNFFDISNTLERIIFFADKVNRIGFGGVLWLLVMAIAVLAGIVIAGKRKKGIGTDDCSKNNTGAGALTISILLLAAAFCYFLTVSKTALMLGDSSIRYQMPVLGVVTVAIGVVIISLLQKINVSGRQLMTAAGSIAAIMIVCNIIASVSGGISFRYPEEKEHRALIRSNTNVGVIYIYNPDPTATWCIWDSTEEFLEFDEVLFLAADSEEELSEEAKEYIASTDTLFTYVDEGVDINKVINRANGILDELSTKEADYSHEFCDVYILNQ